ncbi:hypothetical protein ACFC4G_45405 [Streptomyces sp. NPDC056002]|uniref:hypothetical protein n=1 Tax=Streptomyces sp. NPDC056002 TaxID=3345675 RepID=UPI0035DF4720
MRPTASPHLLPAAVITLEGLSNAPVWSRLVCLTLILALSALHLVFPQESEHRLAWWKDRRTHRQHRHPHPLHGPRPTLGDPAQPRRPQRRHDPRDAEP